MHIRLALAVLIAFFTLPVLAEPDAAIYFYRSADSTFPSGQKKRSELEKTRIGKASDNSVTITKDGRPLLIDAGTMLRDSDLSEQKSANGRPLTSEKGLAINLLPSSLRAGADWRSDTILVLPTHSKMHVVNVQGSWAKVLYREEGHVFEGFVELSSLVLKADFASFALNEKGVWLPVLYRDLNELVLEQNQRIKLDAVSGMITRPELGIISQKDDKLGLSLKSHVLVQDRPKELWNVSVLSGHGKVVWRPLPAAKSESDTALQSITTEELLRREVTAVAFHPSDTNIGLASSQGIYLTNDGETWKKISADLNGPVAIGPKGQLVVGDSISTDNGKSFRRFLKWDELAHIIEINKARNVPELHLQQVAFAGQDKLDLVFDTGLQKIRMRGSPANPLSWRCTE